VHAPLYRAGVLDCGGKRSATPLSNGRGLGVVRERIARAKAPSPLRSAGAVQDAGAVAKPLRIVCGLCQKWLESSLAGENEFGV